MRLKPGDKITFSLLNDGTLVWSPKLRRVTDLAGLLHTPGREPVPLGDMKVELSARVLPHAAAGRSSFRMAGAYATLWKCTVF